MADSHTTGTLATLLKPYGERAETHLERLLVEPGTPETLAEAMRYCILGGGKRLRPAVVWLACEAADAEGGADGEAAARAAVAVELVHGYSLVHDDLPSMDDDTLRRGRPTAHVQFGEAMAVLAGDALLTRAFGVLAGADTALAGPLAGELARGAGPAGMIAGQVADMDLCDVPDGAGGVDYVHRRKTAALIRAAARMGAICARADETTLAAVSDWAEALGLAFQMMDDLLDVTASAADLGKTPGKDADAGKRSAIAAMGAGGAERAVDDLTARARGALAPLGGRGAKLAELTALLARRRH